MKTKFFLAVLILFSLGVSSHSIDAKIKMSGGGDGGVLITYENSYFTQIDATTLSGTAVYTEAFYSFNAIHWGTIIKWEVTLRDFAGDGTGNLNIERVPFFDSDKSLTAKDNVDEWPNPGLIFTVEQTDFAVEDVAQEFWVTGTVPGDQTVTFFGWRRTTDAQKYLIFQRAYLPPALAIGFTRSVGNAFTAGTIDVRVWILQ